MTSTRLARVVGTIGVALAVGLASVALASPARADVTPAELSHVGDARQVIIVSAPSWSSHVGTLSAWRRTAHGWRRVLGPFPATLGARGLVAAAQRRQGTSTTPAGTFALVSAFGRRPDPGAHLPYRRLTTDDAWPYNPADPATYNVFQDAHHSWASYGNQVEHLAAKGRQYDYVAVLDYNLPPGPISRDADGVRRTASPANTRAGGGIFLHVSNGRLTTGCVSIPEPAMRAVLTWMRPGAVIVIGPESDLPRM